MGKNDGKDLLAISFAASSVLAEGKNADEINLLGAFFTVLGDSLTLISTRMELNGNAAETNPQTASTSTAANGAAAAVKNAQNTENDIKTDNTDSSAPANTKDGGPGGKNSAENKTLSDGNQQKQGSRCQQNQT